MNARHPFRIRFACFWLLVLALATPPGGSSSESFSSVTRDLPERFANPPAASRILKIIHGWPDAPEAQDGLIKSLLNQGFGGVVCNISFDQYLQSETRWDAFKRAVGEARQAGMSLWLYDERGYPSGNAGGLVLRDHPEWEARGWLVADRECRPGPLLLEIPPGSLLLAVALPISTNGMASGGKLTAPQIDLKDRVDLTSFIRNGQLEWSVPAGRWHVMVFTENRLFEGTHAEGNYSDKIPYVNLLLPEPTRLFIDLTHKSYAAHLGKDLGSRFVATFTDEPSLMSCYLRPMPWRPLPWAPNLPVEFKRRRGYALDTMVMPALIGDAGPRGAKIRYDYWQTVGELVSANYFGQIQDRCREWNIPSGGHLLMEEGLVAHVPLYGDFFRCLRKLDAPGIDCLTSLPAEVPWFIARMASSAAELDSKPVVMSETSDHVQVYRKSGDTRPRRTVTEAEIRGTCNKLIVSGINTITSYYGFTDLQDDALRRLNEWIGRCCTQLTGGHQVADIALLYPAESIWPRFHPARVWANDTPAATAIENTWRNAASSLFAAQRDFTVIDSRTLAEAKVQSGSLVHGSLRWRTLILPATDTLPKAAWENLARFIRSGGVVITLGTLPTNSESELPSPSIQALGKKLFCPDGSPLQSGAKKPLASSSGSNRKPVISEVSSVGSDVDPCMKIQKSGGAGIYLPAGSEGLLPLALDGVLGRDVAVLPKGSPIRSTHRHIGGSEVYFLINDSEKPWSGTVTLSASGPGERWDPSQASVVETNLGNHLRLSLQPYGAALLRYPRAILPERFKPHGINLPNLIQRSVPISNPSVIQGEFVRAEVVSDPSHSIATHPSYRAAATLTKGKVDTWMFLRFPFPEPIDLTGTECLVLDAWVPEGQRATTQLLAVVQEKGGGDFLAGTGGLLGAPGHHRLFVPINRLELANWSKDGDGELDLKQVSEIRIGWGGYFGEEGEKVSFTLALPRIGSTSATTTPLPVPAATH